MWPLWRVVKLSYFFGLLRTLSRLIACCFLPVLLPVLARVRLLVTYFTLYVAIFSRPPLCGGFFLIQRLLAPPVCSLGEPEPPPRHPYCWGLGALAYLYFACWFSWPTLPRWPMRVGRRYQNWSTRPRWLCLCYLTQLLASLCGSFYTNRVKLRFLKRK